VIRLIHMDATTRSPPGVAKGKCPVQLWLWFVGEMTVIPVLVLVGSLSMSLCWMCRVRLSPF
jgi:hypothetical protein